MFSTVVTQHRRGFPGEASQQPGATDDSLTLLIQGPKLSVHQTVTRCGGQRGCWGCEGIEEGAVAGIVLGYNRIRGRASRRDEGVCRTFLRPQRLGH